MSYDSQSKSVTVKAKINRFVIGHIKEGLSSRKYLLSIREGANPHKTGRHVAYLVSEKYAVLAGSDVVQDNIYLYIHGDPGIHINFDELGTSLSSKVSQISFLSEEKRTPARIIGQMIYNHLKASKLFDRMTYIVESRKQVIDIYFRVDVERDTVYLTLNPRVESDFTPIEDPSEWINERVYCQNLRENSYGIGVLDEVTNVPTCRDKNENYRHVYVKYVKKEWPGEEPPSLYELWTGLGYTLDPNELVVKIRFPKREPCSYPCSKIYKYECVPLPKEIWKAIIETCLRKIKSTRIGELRLDPPTRMEEVELIDLMDSPVELEFRNGKQIFTRSEEDPDRLSTTPKKELKRLGSLYGKRKIHLIVVHPSDMGGPPEGTLYPDVFCRELKTVMTNVMKLAEDVTWDLIPYTFPDLKKTRINQILWEKQLSGEIGQRLNKAKVDELEGDRYPICLCLIPKKGQATLKFKEWFHDYLTRELGLLVQGVDTRGAASSYDKIVKKRQIGPLETLSILIYYNAIINRLHKLRGEEDIDDSVLWTFSRPMGFDGEERRVYIGYDASGEPTEPTRSPTGAFYTILDDYGRLITTGCVEEEKSHKGRLDEYALRRILQRVTQKNSGSPRTIVLLIDGWAESRHWDTLNRLYEELKQTNGSKTPSLIMVEVVKSSPYRLIKEVDQNKIENIPFGYMTFLSDRDVLMITHPLLTSKDKLKRTVRYSVKGKYTPQGFRDLQRREAQSLMRALFHSCFLTFSSGSVPYRLCKPIHSTHKLSKLFYKMPSSRKEIFMKE